MNTYQPEKHRSDGGFRLAGLPLLFGTLFVAAAGLGWLASFIGQWFYLIFLFPLVIAVSLVIVGAKIGQWTHLRNGFIAGIAGLFAGVVSITSMHYFDSVRYFDTPEVKQKFAALPPETRPSTFPRYMDLMAIQGVGIGKDGLNLGYFGSWIYWGVEMLLVAGFTFYALIGGTQEPYCSSCERWKVYRELGTLRQKGDRAKECLESGDLPGLLKLEPSPTGGDLVLSVGECPVGGGDCPITVKLESVTINAKKEVEKKELLEMTYPGEAIADLEALFVPVVEVVEPAKPTKKAIDDY